MKITNVKVYGLAESIVASGLPMLAGFDESEFDRDCSAVGGWLNEAARLADGDAGRHLRRAKTLSSCEGGESHDCFLCGIIVQMNLTAPRYWWPEFQRYHFADIVSSTSTMHRLKTFAKAYSDAVKAGDTALRRSLLEEHFSADTDRAVLDAFAESASKYLSDDGAAIERLKANLPEGWLQTARITTNYRQLKTWLRQRSGHRLKDWRELCQWIHTLPMFDQLVGGRDG